MTAGNDGHVSQSLIPAFLKCPMNPFDNDAGASTVREYLSILLTELWVQEYAFSGKRPFGESSWKEEIYTALAVAGLMEAILDEGGQLQACSSGERQRIDYIIHGCIVEMGKVGG